MTTLEAAQMLVAVASLAFTLFFWLVAARNRRPRLSAHWLERKSVDVTSSDDGRSALGQKIEFAVVNLSERLCVLIDVRIQVRSREGTWVGVPDHGLYPPRPVKGFDGYPVNLLPRRLSRVWAWAWVPLPPDLCGLPRDEQLRLLLADPMEVRVEMRTLGGHTFVSVVRPSN